jgi:hypothetical protein
MPADEAKPRSAKMICALFASNLNIDSSLRRRVGHRGSLAVPGEASSSRPRSLVSTRRGMPEAVTPAPLFPYSASRREWRLSFCRSTDPNGT